MRRVVFDGYGPPGVMRVVDCPIPRPGDTEVLVRTVAAGVNFIDIYQRTGAYTVPLPGTLGVEGGGVVERVGAAVRGVAQGDRVAWMGVPGSYATHVLVPAGRLIPVPDDVALVDAAAVLVQGMTAHMLANDVARLGGTSTCLVHAAAGGVGGLLCQLAEQRGATVIGTVSSPAKADAARAAGAHHVLSLVNGGFAGDVRDLTGGRGVDVVYDAVGRDTFAEGLACLRPRGTFVLYGQTSGSVPPVDPRVLNGHGSLFFTKASLSHYDTTPEQVRRRAAEVMAQVAQHRLRIRLHATFTLDDVVAAHEEIESRRAVGKILLAP